MQRPLDSFLGCPGAVDVDCMGPGSACTSQCLSDIAFALRQLEDCTLCRQDTAQQKRLTPFKPARSTGKRIAEAFFTRRLQRSPRVRVYSILSPWTAGSLSRSVSAISTCTPRSEKGEKPVGRSSLRIGLRVGPRKTKESSEAATHVYDKADWHLEGDFPKRVACLLRIC